METPSTFIRGILLIFVAFYGLFTFCMYSAFFIWSGAVFQRTTEQRRLELLLAKDRLWNLSKQWEGFSHHFLTLKNGFKFHYVSSDNLLAMENTSQTMATKKSKARKPLVIFMHGFPDSWAIWRHLLVSSVLWEKSTIVAFDLPGYGGSDSLKKYGATEVLEHVAEFILAIRRKYGINVNGNGDGDKVTDSDTGAGASGDKKQNPAKVILVAHDWGAVIGFRLASEAPQLVDRFILTNGPLLPLARANISLAWKSSGKMLMTFLRNPFHSHRLLLRAISRLSPLLRQLFLSGYIFVFQLPMPIVRYVGSGGNYSLLKAIHQRAAGKVDEFTVRDAQESMASTLGPGSSECNTTTKDGEGYPPSVLRRSKLGNFGDMISYYRHGAAVSTWHKSLETISALYGLGESRRTSSGMPLQDGPHGALRANATIVWGERDRALDPRVILEGIADYLVHGSQLVILPRTAHYTPMEVEGCAALEKAVEWAICGEHGDVGAAITDVYPGAVVTVRK
ncbi:uncharacterized protein PADG_00472 [Paracoccidioides brasiliensis Pb18]|uniref:AB hydrolase-1 domain-containing protein n=1 Tax=Paracoccidioides brasiliensis (strain Pb18) TaxID=502780 RepID=C1G0T2_PARBD|nr:uncharacterized protein PADG_00472 [Paracoccidioides brasiliensis Pb18]EEH44183.1 hypothetical protein PADG_00472 [Paracoccidioides brasiliensis Pb18]